MRYDGNPAGAFYNMNDASKFMAHISKFPGYKLSKFSIARVTGSPVVSYEASGQLDENEARVYVNGAMVRMQLVDPVLARAYKNFGTDHLIGVLRVGRAINAWLSKAYTGYNPEFLLKNVMRDFTEGAINLTGDYGAGVTAKVIANYPKAFGQLLRYASGGKASPEITEYRADGGSTGAAYLGDLERIGEDAKRAYQDAAGVMATAKSDGAMAAAKVAGDKTVSTLAHYIEVMNQAGENAMRLATYMALRDNGYTRPEAALAAKEVTLNFNRKGELGAAMGALYLFFNPAIQGAARSVQTLLFSEHRNQARALTAAVVTLGFTMAHINFGVSKKVWETTPGYIKGHNLVVPLSDDKQVMIPVPYGYGFFLSLGTVTHDINVGVVEKKDAAWTLANAFAESYSPVGNPFGEKPDYRNLVELLPLTPVKAAGEIGVNRSGLGGPIYPDNPFHPGAPDSASMFRNTQGTVWDWMAGGLNKATGGSIVRPGWVDVHPDVLKSLWTTATGGTGRFITDTVQLANLTAQGVKPDLREMPVVRQFVREAGTISDSRKAFYDAVDELRKDIDHLALIKVAMRNANRSGNPETIKDVGVAREEVITEEKALIAMGKVMLMFEKAIKVKQDRILEIQSNNKSSLSEKRAAIKQVEKEQQQLYDRFVSIFKSTKDNAKAELDRAKR